MNTLLRWGIMGSLVLVGSQPLWALEEAASPTATAPTAAAPAEPFVGAVTGSTVNIRAGANRNYEIIHQAARGDQLLVTGQQGEWYAVVLPPEAACFISAQFVAREGSTAGRVTGSTVNLRGGAGTKYNVLGKIGSGETVTILGEQDGWLRIAPPATARGWIAKSFVQPESSISSETVRAAYDTRLAALAATAAGALPPTGAGTAGGRALLRNEPPLAQGRLERARGFWKKPGTHRLLQAGNTVAHLKSEAIALDDFLHQDVAVWGHVADPSSNTPLITVTQLTPEAPAAVPAAATTPAGPPPAAPE